MGLLNADEEVYVASKELVFFVNGKKVSRNLFSSLSPCSMSINLNWSNYSSLNKQSLIKACLCLSVGRGSVFFFLAGAKPK